MNFTLNIIQLLVVVPIYILFLNKNLSGYISDNLPVLKDFINLLENNNPVFEYWANIESIFQTTILIIKLYREILNFKPYIEFLNREKFIKSISRAIEIFMAVLFGNFSPHIALINFILHEFISNFVSKKLYISYWLSSNLFIQFKYITGQSFKNYLWTLPMFMAFDKLKFYPFKEYIRINIPGREKINKFDNKFRYLEFNLIKTSVGSYWQYLRMLEFFKLMPLNNKILFYCLHPLFDIILFLSCFLNLLGEELPLRQLKPALRSSIGSIEGFKPGDESVDFIKLKSFKLLTMIFISTNFLKLLNLYYEDFISMILFSYNILYLTREIWSWIFVFRFNLYGRKLTMEEKKKFLNVINW